MQTHKLTMNIQDTKARPWGHIYKKQKKQEPKVMFNRYEGKSLQEIEEQYGTDARMEVYSHAAAGLGDLTKPEMSMPVIEVDELFDVMLRRRETGCKPYKGWYTISVQIWIMHNEYTDSHRDRHIGSLEFSELIDFYQGAYPDELLFQIKSMIDNI